MPEVKDDFQATVDDIAQDARELEQIESEKAGLDPADPRVRPLSARAEEVAERLHHKTLMEQDLAETAAEEG